MELFSAEDNGKFRNVLAALRPTGQRRSMGMIIRTPLGGKMLVARW